MKPIPYQDLGQGPLLHFAHANGYPPGVYRQFLSHLANDYHVLAMEQRPLWPGEQPEQLTSWHLLADDLIRFLEERGAKPVIGAGHSLGAVVTMVAAIRRPDFFRQLVLVDPVFLAPEILTMAAAHPEQAFEIPLVHIARKRRNHWPSQEAAFAHFRQKEIFHRFSDEALRDYAEHGLAENHSGVHLRFSREWEARLYSTPPLDVWELIPQIPHPTLAVRAGDSNTLSPVAWRLWQELQPSAQFVEMEGTGHLVPLERPAELTTVVTRFLHNV
jgi:pimeloyl-ACP methyl ester carboxylesterase